MCSAAITLNYKGHIVGQIAGILVILSHHVGDRQGSESESHKSNGILSIHI